MNRRIILKDESFDYALRKSKRARRMRLTVYCDGSVVVTTPPYLGEIMAERFIREKAEWVFSKINFFKKYEGNPIARHGKTDYLKYKEETLKLIIGKIEYFNIFYRYKYHKISIRNQKTRWGSCSKKGNLNFNYRIVSLPEKLVDYIIVHELCHLKEFNHSKRFWNLVEKAIPNYSALRKELRLKGLNLY